MSSSAVHGYRFAEFTLDVTRRRLTQPGQEPIPVPARAFEVLAFLLVHRDRLVTKQELLDEVWPRLVVEENNLTQAISTLRRLLGDTRESPRFIATIAGRGYQFVASVQPLVDDIESMSAAAEVTAPIPLETTVAAAAASRAPMSRRRWIIAAGTTAVALTVGGVWAMRSLRRAQLPTTIAVLPFKPLLSISRNEAIEFGVAELLINRLSALPGIVVSPLSSVRRYSSLEQDPLAAGQALGVAAVVDGYVQIRQGDVRLTARLLDVATGQAIWAGSFTERLGDFFAVQDSLITQLVTALPVELPDSARRRLVAHSTADGEAWQLYANGRYLVERRDQQSIRRARDFFEAAIARDPHFHARHHRALRSLGAVRHIWAGAAARSVRACTCRGQTRTRDRAATSRGAGGARSCQDATRSRLERRAQPLSPGARTRAPCRLDARVPGAQHGAE